MFLSKLIYCKGVYSMFKFKINNIDSNLNVSKNFIKYGNKLIFLNTNTIQDNRLIYLKLNSNCNISCTYCYQSKDEKKSEEVNLKNYELVLNKELKNSDNDFVLFGGEPFLRSNGDKIQYIFDLLPENKKITFYTNACYTSYFNDFLYNNKNKIKELIITIDGPEQIHNSRRRMKNNNSYKVIMENIKFYLQKDLPFSIQVNLDKDNVESINDLLQDIERRFHPSTFDIVLNKVLHTNNTLNEIRLLKLFLDIKERYPTFRINVNSVVLAKIKNYITNQGISRSRCKAGKSLVLDFSTRQIYTCPQSTGTHVGFLDFSKISILEEELKDVFNYCNKLENKCSDCLYVNFCKFGCYIDRRDIFKNCIKETTDEIQFILDNFDKFFELKLSKTAK